MHIYIYIFVCVLLQPPDPFAKTTQRNNMQAMQSQSSQAATIFAATPWLRYLSFNSDILWNLLSPFLGGGHEVDGSWKD